MKELKRVFKIFAPGQEEKERVVKVVGIVNIGVFFITAIISLLTEGKISAMSSSNLVIGVACLSISKNIKSKIVQPKGEEK